MDSIEREKIEGLYRLLILMNARNALSVESLVLEKETMVNGNIQTGSSCTVSPTKKSLSINNLRRIGTLGRKTWRFS